jgi:hypothetical protein
MIGGGTTTGGGGGANWAWADVDASARVSAKPIARAVTSRRPAPVFPDCEGPAEQRINIIPKKSAARAKNTKMPSADADLRSVLSERQSVTAAATGRLAVIVVPLPQLATGALPISATRRQLAKQDTRKPS